MVAQTILLAGCLLAAPRLSLDFEHGPQAWAVEGTTAVEPAGVGGPVEVVAREDQPGNHCARLTRNARVLSPVIPYSGERIHVRLSMRLRDVRAGENHWNRAGAQLLALDGNREPVKVHWGHWDVALEDGTWPWLPYTRRLLLPAEVKYLRLQLMAWDISGGEALVDDASLELRPAGERLPEAVLAVGTEAGEPIRHFWYGTDAGHAERIRFPHYQRALDLLPSLGFTIVRVHTPLACIKYDEAGTPVDYAFLDQVLGDIVRRGLRVYFTFEPMPDALASRPKTSWCNLSPPKDYDRWTELCRRVVEHLEEVFGTEEVRRWVFSVWNEPFASGYFDGTHEDYLRVYEATVKGALAADEGITIGGLDGADDDLTREFLAFVAKNRLRCDVLSVHFYAGSGFAEAFPMVRWLPMRLARVRDAMRAAGLDLPLHITECNLTSSPRRYSEDAHGATFFARAVAELRDAPGLESLYYFCLADHPYQEEKMFVGGIGLTAPSGIAKPVVNTFRMLAELQGRWLPLRGGDELVGAMAALRDDGSVAALVWNYSDDQEETAADRAVRLRLPVPEGTRYTVCLLDDTHSNPFDAWEAMGSPQTPTDEQLVALREAEALEQVGEGVVPADGIGLTMKLSSLALIIARP